MSRARTSRVGRVCTGAGPGNEGEGLFRGTSTGGAEGCREGKACPGQLAAPAAGFVRGGERGEVPTAVVDEAAASSRQERSLRQQRRCARASPHSSPLLVCALATPYRRRGWAGLILSRRVNCRRARGWRVEPSAKRLQHCLQLRRLCPAPVCCSCSPQRLRLVDDFLPVFLSAALSSVSFCRPSSG